MWDSFEVRDSKGSRISGIVSSVIFLLGMIVFEAFAFVRELSVLVHFLSLVFIVLFLFLIFDQIFHFIRVEGNEITETNLFGKEHTISVYDITKIECFFSNGVKTGPRRMVFIYTKGRRINVSGATNGFGMMTTYLLAKLESGEINSSVITTFHRKQLQEFDALYRKDSRKPE